MLATGCAAPASTSSDGAPLDDQASITVLVAASLTGVMAELASSFERDHQDAQVVISAGGSATLREQLAAGAPADVFIPASLDHISAAASHRDFADEPVALATNRLALAVPTHNPAAVSGLADVARSELLVGLCDPAVPCGALAQQWLASTSIAARPDTLTLSVSDLATKLATGELDVGVVYASDVSARSELREVETDQRPPSTTYFAAVLTDASSLRRAQRFVEHLAGSGAAQIFERHGFGPAPGHASP